MISNRRIKLVVLVVLIIMVVAFGSSYYLPKLFNQSSPQPTAPNDPKPLSDVTTTYEGTLPCADCSGLLTELTLTKTSQEATGGAYILEETYLGKSDEPLVKKGNWVITKGNSANPNAVIYELDPDKLQETSYYLEVDEKTIKMLDKDKNEINSPFNLTLSKNR